MRDETAHTRDLLMIVAKRGGAGMMPSFGIAHVAAVIRWWRCH